jgi:hypothetical protein
MPLIPNKKTRFNVSIALRAFASRGSHSRQLFLHDRTGEPTDILLCLVDHFEPHVGKASDDVARSRMEDWVRRYPEVAVKHRDADGRHPAHGFFYPWDEFDAWECDRIADLCAQGWGELDLHLHHFDDTEAGLRRKIRDAVEAYSRRGALTRWPDGRHAFGFIHGNWALDNSRCENGKSYCGVNNEIDVLLEEGCYADFTFPAWGHLAQPTQFNDIHYAVDDPARPKSYDRGEQAKSAREGQGLLLVQGPLVARRRGARIVMDDADLAYYRRYRPERLDGWVRCGIHVLGRPDRIFIKLHCHGAQDRNREALLGEDLHAMYSDAEARYNDGRRWRLHYVTAREMYNVVRATEADAQGSIDELRDYHLPQPACRAACSK